MTALPATNSPSDPRPDIATHSNPTQQSPKFYAKTPVSNRYTKLIRNPRNPLKTNSRPHFLIATKAAL